MTNTLYKEIIDVMHDFPELIDRCATFTLRSLNELEEKIHETFQTSSATSLVKTSRMIRMQKTIFAVGVFSIFEAALQDGLNCRDGFAEAKIILKQKGDSTLLSQFTDLELAINALKHGKGRSYNTLVEKDGGTLNSNIKRPEEHFFYEGDVSEINILIDVDERFIHNCVEVINEVCKAIKDIRSEIVF